ncbi:MAG: adenylate/guanylate cyclase domain-containing protein, partial [Burkholderiaceae bacterium]
LLTVGGIMIFLFPWRSPLWATVAAFAALLAVVGINLGFWQYMNHVVPLATSLLLVGGLYVLSMSYGYFFESKTKKQFAELFGQYVPPELVEEMSRSPESYNMAGRRAELSVLFSDIRGFTSFSEGMEPEQLASLMNEYLSAMTLVVRKHRGTLDKYIGDAIMAFWGAPVADPEHARNAVLAALEMQHALGDLNKTLKAKGAPEIRIGVGVNTGIMTVGDMGSSIRKAYTVMGDAVNLGSRLEGITKQYGVGIMVGEETRKAIKDIVFRELDLVQVKGKEEPVAIYEPLGILRQIEQARMDELEKWHQALSDYRHQHWDKAESALLALTHATPDCMLYQIYLERIRHLRENPPGAEWSGVTKFDTK